MVSSRDISTPPENLGQRLIEENHCDDSLTYVSPLLTISKDPKLVAHGRGLVATSSIESGELLFVHPPTVKAEISQVLRIYQNKASNASETSGSSSLLESIAETVLLKEMKRVVRSRKKANSAKIAASFLALNSDHSANGEADMSSSENEEKESQQLLKVLLGMGSDERVAQVLEKCGGCADDKDYLLGIIRHNAFGPDFHHYHRMENELLKNNNSDDNSTKSSSIYSRILGHYPLAAMINHSCGPTNATRVFYNEVMVATATQTIPAGTEILWPYCPPISPFPLRNEQLTSCYGFSCLSSRRSILEKRAYDLKIPPPEIPLEGANENSFGGGESSSEKIVDAQLDLNQWDKILKSLDVWYKVVAAKSEVSDTSSNEEEQQKLLEHGLRLGHTQLYIRYFNKALQQQQVQNSQREALQIRAKIVSEAEKLHAAFSVVHNACTEHLSLLHLCYELSATKVANTNDHGGMNDIRFWTEELKKAHLSRYSTEVVGKDLATLRNVLKHTRTVLRTQDGWKHSHGTNSFI